ncbi:unnamed protein product [Prorocentrum cordatum]|uniref:Pentacotripeptide-repeat region of PRORP domain-containing protein n=1 Tax=Prorocentrum cordatum TaxID=2364126 RepID=A0ABN9TJR0_9DINO|nr:unnamed protein product [Polarella glacialis]
MLRRGARVDTRTVSKMLSMTLGKGGSSNTPQARRAIALVGRFVQDPSQDVDEILFNGLLDACCRLRDWNHLAATIHQMQMAKVAPSSVTQGILLKAYGGMGDLQNVLAIWKDLEQQLLECSDITIGCMIDACVKCGDIEKAAEVFEGLRQQGKHRNSIYYTQLIKGYGQQKDLSKALKLFREMPKEGVPRSTITYNSIIDACIRSGKVLDAEQIFGEMVVEGGPTQPDLITFSTMVKGHCQRGDLDKALNVAETIRARGMGWDELVYNTLLDGCVKAKDISLGVGLWQEMVSSGVVPSTITHNILLRLYRSQGHIDEDSRREVQKLYEVFGCQEESDDEEELDEAGETEEETTT